nr:MAG TPA: hypothetical protein [Caudoviricetes sp.]
MQMKFLIIFLVSDIDSKNSVFKVRSFLTE